MINAQLPDGTTLQFPDGTPDAVVNGTVKQHVQSLPGGQVETPESKMGFSPAPPEEKAAPASAAVPQAVGDTLVSPDDVARVNAPPANPPITSLEDLRGRIQQGDINALKYLKPTPDDSTLTSAGKDVAMLGVHGLATLAQMPINALIGLGQGPAGALTINPATNTLGITPEAQAAASFFPGGPLKYSGTNALMRTPDIARPTFGRPPPVSLDELNAAITRAGPEPPAPSAPPADGASAVGAAPTTSPGVWVPIEPGMRYPGQQTRINPDTGRGEVLDATRGAPATPPPSAAPAAPAGPTPAPSAAPGRAVPPTVPPGVDPASPEGIMASAKAVAQQHYDIADANGQGSAYTPQSVNKMVDAVDAVAPQGPGARAVGGDNEVTRLQSQMQPLRDHPLTLSDVQAMDETMSGLISKALRSGDNKVANNLQDIQQAWREQADGVTANDVTGGTAGFQALDPARQAWAQYRKMSDVQLMKERADMTQNPTTSYKTAVKNFVTGRNSRGWSDDEKAALVASADRGVLGGALHLLGSRLLPHVGGSVGASIGGIPGFLAGEVVTHGLGEVARNTANNMQTGRVTNAMGVLNSRVPQAPINPLLP
jgi:hypothetical protein